MFKSTATSSSVRQRIPSLSGRCVFLMYRVPTKSGDYMGSREKSFPDELAGRQFAEDNDLQGFLFDMKGESFVLIGQTHPEMEPTRNEELIIRALSHT